MHGQPWPVCPDYTLTGPITENPTLTENSAQLQLIGTQASLHQAVQEETENPAQLQRLATEIPTLTGNPEHLQLTGNPAHSSDQPETTKLEIQADSTKENTVENHEEDPEEHHVKLGAAHFSTEDQNRTTLDCTRRSRITPKDEEQIRKLKQEGIKR